MSSAPPSSSPPSPDSPDSQPGRPFPIFWSHVPSIKIVRQPKGRFSPQVDERCFTYCSQTVRGRTEQREPFCRTFCLRRVFSHEVTKAIAAHDGQKSTVPLKYPLPPEGQRTPGLVDVLIGETEHESGRGNPEEVRHWDEGYYVWFSKSRWAAQEKMDLMMYNLERHAAWQRYKQQVTEKWEQQERQRGLKGSQPAGDATAASSQPPPPQSSGTLRRGEAVPKRPFPDMSGQSILLPVPPPFPPIQEQIHNLLAPSYKVIDLTRESVNTGAQLKFMQLIWEKAWTEEPFVLARNVCTKMWDKWKKGPPDDSV